MSSWYLLNIYIILTLFLCFKVEKLRSKRQFIDIWLQDIYFNNSVWLGTACILPILEHCSKVLEEPKHNIVWKRSKSQFLKWIPHHVWHLNGQSLTIWEWLSFWKASEYDNTFSLVFIELSEKQISIQMVGPIMWQEVPFKVRTKKRVWNPKFSGVGYSDVNFSYKIKITYNNEVLFVFKCLLNVDVILQASKAKTWQSPWSILWHW
jgi:hypothetical protein